MDPEAPTRINRATGRQNVPAHVRQPRAGSRADVVAVSGAGITVNGRSVQGTAQLSRDSAGLPLQSVPAGAYPVAPGEVWLLSGHDPRSFDSRYFGPVPESSIQGVTRPLMVLP